MTDKFKLQHTKDLQDAGLNHDQAEIYQLLIKLGPRSASTTARLTKRSRPHAYKLLYELVELGLITTQKNPGEVTKFYPEHPFALSELMRRKQEQLRLQTEKINSIISSLISDFTRSSSLPGIKIHDGLAALEEVYEDIIHTAQNVDLIRCQIDNMVEGYKDLISDHIHKKITKGISTRVIGPLSEDMPLEELRNKDIKRLMTRRVSPEPLIGIKSEIVLFGNKVAITTFEPPFITTSIENEAIVQTFKAVFESVWLSADAAY